MTSPLAARPPIRSGRLALLLAGLAMLGPFSVDTYFPAFPNIERSLDASPLQVQQTLTAYLLSFAFMILWHGALSDALGRRVVVLVSLAVFAVASLGCASAHTIHYLWAFRILQGISAGAGIVVGRAMIRDVYAGPEAERLMSLVTMIFAIGPAIAPILGGWIVSVLNWRAIFLFLFGFTLVMLVLCWRMLPETLPVGRRTPLNARSLARNYRAVFSAARFHLYAGVVSFNFAGLFVYISAAPVFVVEHLHLGPTQFAWLFAPSVSGIFLGALTANRLAGRISVVHQVRGGFVLMGFASVVNLCMNLAMAPQLPYAVMPLFFYTFGMSLAAPGVTLMVLDLFPSFRGVAASCQSFAQTFLSSLVAGLISPFLAPSYRWLAVGQLAFLLAGLACWVLGQSRHSAQRA